MEQVDFLHNITSYWLTRKNLFFVENNELLKSDKSDNCILYKKRPRFTVESFYRIQNDQLSETNSGKLNYIDENLNVDNRIQIGNANNIAQLNNSFFRFSEEIKRKIFRNGICDGSGNILWSFDESVIRCGWGLELMIYSKYLDDEEIFKRDILTGETLWSFNASEIGKYTDYKGEHTGEIRGKIQLWNNYLIVPLTGKKLIALDYSTGKIVWEAIVPFSKYEIYNDKIVCLYESAFLEIDLSTGKTLRDINLDEYLKIGKGIDRIPEYKIENDRIYLTDYRKFKIGILDYNSLELIDIVTINHQKDAWQIGDLEVQNGKIYVLEYLEDLTKNLHIYKDDIV
ncbi:PQQ-binding-like beta-propeller repeat protein [Labilibacter marinus]|uniref:PQQ-binding-like beta-propeller repeat protein n=1 Tax=Labilibacter marinus TaxID=1477105 RepID=UPI00082D7B36|nr:PQQ-binding-like beta-propeller repeat protein [Labilibacter marinus]